MEDDFVSRSRLFREGYLTDSYPTLRNKAFGRVVGTSGTASSLDGLDKEQLREVISNFIANWESSGGITDPMLTSAVDQLRLEFQAPSEIYVEPAPLVLACSVCKVVDYFDFTYDSAIRKIEKDIRQKYGRTCIPCKREGCGGIMIQIPYVAVHRCGSISSINIDPRLKYGSTKFSYIDKGSFFHSKFVEVGTNKKLDNTLQGKCSACDKKYLNETSNRGTPISSGEAFHPQTVQYIALGEVRGKLVSRIISNINSTAGGLTGVTEDIAEGIALGILGLISIDELERKLNEILSGGSLSASERSELEESKARKQKVLDQARLFIESNLELAEILKPAEKEINDIDLKLGGSAGCFKIARRYFPKDDSLKRLIMNRRAIESIFLPQDVQGLTVETAIVKESDVAQREAMRLQWSFIKEQYGIESITHIPDLRVVLAAVGFTREKSNPQTIIDTPPVTLTGFTDKLAIGLAGKKPIYVLPAKTEALWIKLDPIKVLRWCVDSAGWEMPEKESTLNSKADSLAYLLKNSRSLTLPTGTALLEADKYSIEESAPFHLLHSISHALQLTARRHSGYDSKSIQEYLVPMELSVILYVPSVQDFTPGGLLTLFQHYLKAWFNEASMFAFSCAFDPFCSDNGGSCNGCVQTEIGCETFNRGLSRAYIHGGSINRDGSHIIKRGFWVGK